MSAPAGSGPPHATPGRAEVLADLSAVIDQAGFREEAIVAGAVAFVANRLGDTCTVLLKTEDGRALRPVAVYDPDPEALQFAEAVPALAPSIGDGASLSRRVLETGQAMLIPAVDAGLVRPLVKPEHWPALMKVGPRSLIIVPLQGTSAALGVLHLARHRTDARYQEDDKRLAVEIADRIGRAVSRARTVAALEARARQLEGEARDLRAAAQERVMDRAAAAREAGGFFESMIATSPFLIWRADITELTLTYISPSIENVLGYDMEEALETPGFMKFHMHPSDYEAFSAAVAEADAAAQSQFDVEAQVQHRDGSYRWLYTVASLERDPAGALAGVLGFSLDITSRKTLEATLQQAREDAEKANQAKSEFLSRMSHELRTPLNAVLGFAQLLEMDPLSAEQQESLGYILKAGRHLLDLINEVLDIARIEAGRMSISPEAVPLAEVAREALVLAAPLANDRAIRVHSEFTDDDAHHVLADRQRLKQVLLNLLSNAVKYNKVGGEVLLSYKTLEGRVRVLVTDTGPGIPEDKQSRLFIPFERLGTVQGGVEGTGLGLALSKRLTEAMGGTIGVESQQGHGSTFWVELPLAEHGPEAGDRVAEEVRARAAGLAPERQYSVLYIEDNLAHLDLIERLIARRPGVRLQSAMQGRIGLTLAQEHRPDVILLDMQLPDVPGSEILHRLQADLRTRLIPVIALSSDPSPDEIERLLAYGAHACLAKPFDIKELMTILDEVLKLRID